MLGKYRQLMETHAAIPCAAFLPVLTEIAWLAWKERLAAERLIQKSELVLQVLQRTGNNWEETFWQLLAKGFGLKTNTDAFMLAAVSLPVNILAKHKNQLHQLEALLLGQAGLLSANYKDDYAILLYKEYLFLSKKYKLQPVSKAPAFLRMRPANFPTIRLAQLAMLVQQSSHLLSKIKTATSVQQVMQWFNVTANDYWHYHYRFDEISAFQPKTTGKAFIENILINTVIPVLFTYGAYYKDESWKQKAMEWLSEITGEKNNITTMWMQHQVTNKNALESQALIQLKNNYCNAKKCLDCSVGNRLLKRDTVTS